MSSNENIRPQPSGETREAVAGLRSPLHIELSLLFRDVRRGAKITERDKERATIAENIALSLIRPAPVASGGQHSSGEGSVADIVAERRRQIEAEGWSVENDDEHDDSSLAHAAAAYVLGAGVGTKVVSYRDDVSGGRGETPVWGTRERQVPLAWPASWDARWWKPSNRRRDLVKAGALIVAEIERLDRAEDAK